MKRTLDNMLAPSPADGVGDRLTLTIGNKQLGHLQFSVQVLRLMSFVAPSSPAVLHLQNFNSSANPHDVVLHYGEGTHPLVLGTHSFSLLSARMHASNLELAVRSCAVLTAPSIMTPQYADVTHIVIYF